MAQNKLHKGYNQNFNLVLFTSLVMAGLGVGWLALNGIESGSIYTTLLTLVTVLMLIGFFFIKEDDKSVISKMVKVPLTNDYDLAIPLFLIGWIVAILFNFLVSNVGGFAISEVMVPFAQANIDQTILQSFSAVEISAEPFWRWFVVVFSAGSIEEFLFGFATMFIFGIVGQFVLQIISDGKDLSFISARNFIFSFALIMTMVVFSGIHLLNSTYVGKMFLIAMIFRAVMNMFIYKWGLFLSFTLGYHQSNNAVYFWYSAGPQVTLNALLSVKGLFVLAFFVLMIVYTIKRFPIIIKKLQGFPYS